MAVEVPDEVGAEPSSAAEERLHRRTARWLLGAAGLILGMLALLGLSEGEAGGGAVGTPLPEFELPLLAGGRLGDGDLVGQVTVINVWASWCPPCRSEAPVLRRIADDVSGEGIQFVGVIRNDEPDDAAAFVDDFELTYPNVVDDGSLARALGVRGLPMTFVVAADGTVVSQHFGPITESRLRVLIEDAAGRAAPAPADLGDAS